MVNADGDYLSRVDEETTWRAIDELMTLPTFEQAQAIHGAMMDDLRAALEAVVRPLTWDTEPYVMTTSPCGADYQLTNGQGELVSWEGRPQISDEQWSAAVDVVSKIVSAHGFTDRRDMIDIPGRHTTSFDAPRNGEVTLTVVDQRLAISVSTGCYLSAQTKENIRAFGTPFGQDPYSTWPWDVPSPHGY